MYFEAQKLPRLRFWNEMFQNSHFFTFFYHEDMFFLLKKIQWNSRSELLNDLCIPVGETESSSIVAVCDPGTNPISPFIKSLPWMVTVAQDWNTNHLLHKYSYFQSNGQRFAQGYIRCSFYMYILSLLSKLPVTFEGFLRTESNLVKNTYISITASKRELAQGQIQDFS